MDKAINGQALQVALTTRGWTQKKLAEELGVSPQAVTNWANAAGFPRPDKLLKLSSILELGFDQLVTLAAKQPVVAFRKKGGARTTEKHLVKAMTMAAMLKPIVTYLPANRALRTQIASPSTEYEFLQNAGAEVRKKLGIGLEAVLDYHHLINEFLANDAVIIPVMWGTKDRHENALHIFLPDENVTFIYLNLDTHLEDFKFWMAHELAHIYTQELAGQEEGEDFADAFAGALLFPRELAKIAYEEASRKTTKTLKIEVLRQTAKKHKISLFSVFREVSNYANALGLSRLNIAELDIHKVRNILRDSLVSETLFKPLPPEPSAYIASANNAFSSSFFPALQKMLHERSTGASYVQQVLDVSLKDALAIHAELVR